MNKGNFIRLISVVVLFGLGIPLQARYPADFDAPLNSIAFGSCNRENLPQPAWAGLIEADPDLFIWLGDNVYGDTEDMSVLREKYARTFNQPRYRKFRMSTDIIGTWDDHDFGENNSGNWYPKKYESQLELYRFLEEPNDSERRKKEGVYASYVFGPDGKQVKIILLDNRYFADPPGPDAGLLGEAQWSWLEEELKNSTAQINIIGSGTQIIPRDHRFEKWQNFPKERARLFALMKEYQVPGLIFISGDRHFHEISVINDDTTPQLIPEVTSSSLNQPIGNIEAAGEINRHRLGAPYGGRGYGVIEIDWKGPQTQISLQIRSASNEIVRQQNFPLANLQPDKILKNY